MDLSSTSKARLRRQVILRLVLALPVMMAALFLPAGTFAYWEGWVYLGVIYLPIIFAAFWFYKFSPDLLARRMDMREQSSDQVWIVSVAGVLMIAAFVLPGFDHRWGWSDVPVALVLFADAIVLASYLWVLRVEQVNVYASRVVRVEAGQEVIQTGPYAIVRHPMYLGMFWFMLATPLALGSYWAMIPGALILPVLMARVVAEEELLRRDLPGYVAYTEKVRRRLLPGIW